MTEFNLIEQPWIPCIDLRGRRVEHGIGKTLLRAHELREICDDSPLVTIALHRLLMAILYRVYRGPKNSKEWRNLFTGESFDADSINKYLEKWSGRFDLFAQDFPFYQMGNMQIKRAVSVSRLATECASGNNATLFDHCNDEDGVSWLPAETARSLVACQSFACGGGRSSNAKINGADEKRPNSTDAIALRGMNIWLQGNTLFNTLMINLAPIKDTSLPPWELDDPHRYRDRIDGKKGRTFASLGTVDRLTWQSRLVLLLPDGESCSRMYFTQGRSADKSPDDPMKAYRKSKEEGISPVPLSSRRAAWRDAHSILMIPNLRSNERRPECFNLVARLHSKGEIQPGGKFAAHIVGLATAPNKAAKFVLWRHERMPVPGVLLADNNLIERLGMLLQNAEQAAIVLNRRMRRIAKLYLAPEAESGDGRQPDKEEIARVANAIDARPAYWARLETHFFMLLQYLPSDWDAAHDKWKHEDHQEATNAWRRNVKHEAQVALEESIRSLGTTARVIQAVARVRTDFNDEDLMPQPQEAATAKG
jgi:CRISPR system Cascade subunit CasA